MPQPYEAAHQPDAEASLEPTDAEVEAWAARERQRREAWLRGPTQTEKAEWAARERTRRSGRPGLPAPRLPIPSPETTRQAQQYLREAQLAAEGAMSLMFHFSVRDALDQLVRAGRDWEEEYTSQPMRRRRVALETDTSSTDPRETTGASSQQS